MKDQPIIVFDSGRGGQSIYQPLTQALPNAKIIYLDDASNFPYGNKPVAWLKHRFQELATRFASYNPELVVIACNTATVNGVTELRSLLKCPIIGVEPVIKPLAKYSRALALMTKASAASLRTQELLHKYGAHVQVYTPTGLAEAIEYKNNDQVKKSIIEIKNIVQSQKIEAVGLSCTHYPLILKDFEDAMPDTIFIDPSGSVVEQVLRVLRST